MLGLLVQSAVMPPVCQAGMALLKVFLGSFLAMGIAVGLDEAWVRFRIMYVWLEGNSGLWVFFGIRFLLCCPGRSFLIRELPPKSKHV